MGFELVEEPKLKYKIVKQHFLAGPTFTDATKIYDAGRKTPFYFLCPNCKKHSINIDHLNTRYFNKEGFILDLDEVVKLGGAGPMHKLIKCSHCNSIFYIGIGYFEPNNGRDVFDIHTIIEIAEM
ncbi:hypothetical protein GWK08_01430 [Leptobacterium flavescens]|uniref:Uncharacterized protein n=1 Tax=Leptobacterium flavescens TaxID=472055 RepID=A0A6P0UI14_9FLAO|nr:hypothetical protein [Leptobacterium flavescens]NER12090.1 hypothetical protein [Leptobacterium flavescens]